MKRVTRVRRSAALLVGAAVGLLSSFAGAQAPRAAAPVARQEEHVRVSYRAPSACPTEAEFLERVRSRVRRARFAEVGAPAHEFEITVSKVDGDADFVGRLEFADTDGQRVARSLQGTVCDELASGLALITALALDDRTAEAPPDATSPPPSPPPAAPSAPPKNPEPKAPPRLPEPPSLRPPKRGGLRVELGVTAGVLSWVTASAAPQFGLYAELGSRVSGWSVRLSAFDARRSKNVPEGSADFTADWLRLELCPVTVALGGHFSLIPCLGFDGGQLRASAQQTDTLIANPYDDTLWLSGVALARLSWEYRERLVLGLDGELGVPFSRPSYTFEKPDRTVLEVPKIGLGAKFGIGVRFP
ncbi:MAG: hypothetical protein ABW061_08120 [Polyangiaceae bacterium]